jgi:hypothetical protein
MEKSGFLSKDINKYKERHRKKNEEIFHLCEELNEYAHSTMWKMKITNEYLPEILSACAYVRVLSNFQSIVILTEYGLLNEAKIVLRSFVEGMFMMVAIAKDKDYSRTILEQDTLERERAYKAIKRNIIAGIFKSGKPTLDEVEKKLEEIKKDIEEKNIKKINKRDLSKAADLESYYDTVYHLLSGTVHINPRDLESYLDLTEDRKVKEIKWGPEEEEIEDILFTAIEILTRVLESISNMFEIELDGNWDEIHRKYQQFGAKKTI